MNKQEFLAILRANLYGMDSNTVNDILYDYEEHFRIGLENNKTEEEISKALGNPVQISNAYKADNFIKKAEISPRPYNMFKAVLAGIGLGLFNLAFVVGLYAGIIGIVVGLGGMSLGISFAGIVMIINAFFALPYVSIPFNLSIGLGKLACFISGIGLLSLGLLLLILTVFISRLILQVTISSSSAASDVYKRQENSNAKRKKF